MGRPLADLVAPASRAAPAALFAAPGPGSRSAPGVLGGAAEREFELTVAPLLEASRVVGYAGSAVDVTERSAAQREQWYNVGFNSGDMDRCDTFS